jgi:hypothetical protein
MNDSDGARSVSTRSWNEHLDGIVFCETVEPMEPGCGSRGQPRPWTGVAESDINTLMPVVELADEPVVVRSDSFHGSAGDRP